jgi:hypothetical protein
VALVPRVFWWGFHVEFGHEDLLAALNSADIINAVVAPSPVDRWIPLLAAFISTHPEVQQIDTGCGIYVSMSWFSPGIFIPTPVHC